MQIVSIGDNFAWNVNSNCQEKIRKIFQIVDNLSADDNLKYFSYFSQKTGFDITCKLSRLETICMKCQIQLPGKIKKNISIVEYCIYF